jgi:ferrous iron transport protein A
MVNAIRTFRALGLRAFSKLFGAGHAMALSTAAPCEAAIPIGVMKAADPSAPRRLVDLPIGEEGIVAGVERRADADPIAGRLAELGFVSGEPVRLVAKGPVGGDPLVVQVGYTRFALRRAEAARLLLQQAAGGGKPGG